MLLKDIITEKKAETSETQISPGTFVGANFDKDSVKKLKQLVKKLKVPNPLPSSKYHITMVYSKKEMPDFKPKGKLEKPLEVEAKHFSVFKSQGGSNCLVVELESEELQARHQDLLKNHGATHTFATYKPHITLSYDAGDFKPSDDELKDFGVLYVDEEYAQPIQEDWSKSKD